MANELLLIVEDNEKNRRLLRDILQVNGFRTVESETAEEGIDIARREQPALILMDIQLPGINGIEALHRLKADPETAGIPVMAVTASAMRQDVARIEGAGFDGFQSKPIDIKAIVIAARELIDRVGAGEHS